MVALTSKTQRAVCALALLSLTSCDPLVGVSLRINVPAATQAAYSGGYPAEVVVLYHRSGMIGEIEYYRVGVLCEATPQPITFKAGFGGIGCADEKPVKAWILPLGPGDKRACGQSPEPERLLDKQVSEKPWGEAVVFPGVKNSCGNRETEVDVNLTAPAQK